MNNITINQSQSPKFTAVYTSKNITNNHIKKDIVDAILSKLNEINPLDKKGRSYIDRAEDYGYDVFLTSGNKKNSVRVDVISAFQRDRVKQFGIIPANNNTHIGTYKKPGQFNIEHFNEKYNKMEKDKKQAVMFGYGYLSALLAAGLITLGVMIGRVSSTKEPKTNIKQQTTIIAKDTLKNDTLKPILKDTFNIGKKIIK